MWMELDPFTLFGLFVMGTLMIYLVLKLVWMGLKTLHWIIGMAFYLSLWFFAPKTWKEMHDA